MSTMYGADVAQLRALGREFTSRADQLDANRMSVGNAIQLSAWIGPFAAHFRVQWDSDHSRMLHAAAAALRDAAASLHANANAQERTSAAESGASTPSAHRNDQSGHTQESVRVGRASLTQSLIDNLRGMNDDDGFRIQEIMGTDGKIRYIVYIDGTGASADLSVLNNAGEIMGQNDEIQRKITAALAEATRDHPNAEIMMVGYSQGGMVAQNLASAGRFNVQEVLAYGSPRLPSSNDYDGANVTFLRDRADVVPDAAQLRFVAETQTEHTQDLLGALAGSNEVHEFAIGTSHLGAAGAIADAGARLIVGGAVGMGTLGAQNAVGQQMFDDSAIMRGIAIHEDKSTYDAVAAQFEKSDVAWAQAARTRMSVYDGVIINDTHDSPANTWPRTFDMVVPEF